MLFASGMAAISAVLLPSLSRGAVFVLPDDCYISTRRIARDYLEPRGVEVIDDPHCRACTGAAARPGHAALAREPVEPRPRPVRHPRAGRRRSRARGDGRGGQHACHAARPAPARAGRRLLGHERHQAPFGPRRHAAGQRHGRRLGARRVAARLAHAHGRDPGAVRGLARASLAGHARRPPGARVRERDGDRRAARGPRRRDRRPLPGPARRPWPRARDAADVALRHGRLVRPRVAGACGVLPREGEADRRGHQLRRGAHERPSAAPDGARTRCPRASSASAWGARPQRISWRTFLQPYFELWTSGCTG